MTFEFDLTSERPCLCCGRLLQEWAWDGLAIMSCDVCQRTWRLDFSCSARSGRASNTRPRIHVREHSVYLPTETR